MKILVAIDGSEYGQAALDECCSNFVRPGETEMKIVSAHDDAYPIAAEPFAISSEYYEEMNKASRKQVEGFLESAKQRVKERFPNGKLDLTTAVLHGSPAPTIIDEATEWGADLIVVGSHGRGFWGRMLGSVSDGVVHHAPCSVLVVRGDHKDENE
jgi:nucleotide-binding universal stress UspA family protein